MEVLGHPVDPESEHRVLDKGGPRQLHTVRAVVCRDTEGDFIEPPGHADPVGDRMQEMAVLGAVSLGDLPPSGWVRLSRTERLAAGTP